MAALTALQRLMASPKTARFVETLKHSDLPLNWADDPEIVSMAGDAYRELGEGSPFFKAWKQRQQVNKYVHRSNENVENIRSNGKYGGIFALPDDSASNYGKNKIEVFVKGRKADSDDIQDFLESSKGQEWVKKETFAENEGDIGDVVRSISRETLDDADDQERLFEALGGIDYPDAYVQMQKLRGKAAKDAGFSHVGINDEFDGDTVFIPGGTPFVKAVNNRGTFNPADPNIYRGIIPLMAAGGAAAALAPGSAQAAEWPKQRPNGQLIWPADMPGYRNTEPGLETPLVDPIDIAVAPIGMTTTAGRALAMAAEPGIAYGTDKALGALLGMFQRNTKTGGGGGI